MSIFCTCQGLSPEDVKSLTKHKVDIFRKSYCCEFCIPVLTTIAGFIYHDKTDEYWVPRALIGYPANLDIDVLTRLIFPRIDNWRAENLSRHGDESTAARHFLGVVLPFLAHVVTQDGIYWVHHFPQNPAMNLLLQRLDGHTGDQHYTVWAREKRKWVSEQVMQKNMTRDLAVVKEREALALATRKMEETTRKLEETMKKIEQHHTRQLAENMFATHNPLLHNTPTAATRGMSVTPGVAAVQNQNDRNVLRVEGGRNENALRDTNVAMCSVGAAANVEQTSTTNNPRRVIVLNDFANPRKVTVQALNEYSSLQMLVRRGKEHHHAELLKYSNNGDKRNIPRNLWHDPNQDRNRWSKLKLIYRRIHEKMEDGSTMEAAAAWLDLNEKGEKSMASYHDELKKLEPYRGKTRKRTRRG